MTHKFESLIKNSLCVSVLLGMNALGCSHHASALDIHRFIGKRATTFESVLGKPLTVKSDEYGTVRTYKSAVLKSHEIESIELGSYGNSDQPNKSPDTVDTVTVKFSNEPGWKDALEILGFSSEKVSPIKAQIDLTKTSGGSSKHYSYESLLLANVALEKMSTAKVIPRDSEREPRFGKGFCFSWTRSDPNSGGKTTLNIDFKPFDE